MNLPLSNKQDIFEGGIWDESITLSRILKKIHEDFSVSINCDFLLQTEL